MCGFIGFRDNRANRPCAANLEAALISIRHRGPDGECALVIDGYGFAHARLAIIDLSNAAKQPMVDASGRFVLLFNGEIYNYRELAAAHFIEDPSLNRESDTAVLLAMYVRFGRECVKYLNGMFAFAIVDLHKHTIFMARDRFGEKPLYWINTKDYVAFASEISALKRLLPEHDWSIDPDAMHLYHSIGSIPAPYTIYKGAHMLRAASWIEFDQRGARTEGTYWVLGKDDSSHLRNRQEAAEECRSLLQYAVSSRMVSDVPVGVFLSGGLDSGAILSLASALGGRVPDSLCIDFPESKFSEYHLAAQTAERFGSSLHRSIVTTEEFESHLEAFFRSSDQPTTDGFNTYFVSLHAKALGIKVWLSGVGGDELFGGYPSFIRIGRLTRLSTLGQCLMPSSLGNMIEVSFPTRYRWARLANLFRNGNTTSRAYQCLRNTIPPRMVANMMSNGIRRDPSQAFRLVDSIYPDSSTCKDDFQRATLMESGIYMAAQLLRDIDNYSMTHSIEVRAPFLEHSLFQSVFNLKQSYKKGDGRRPKSLLLDALLNPLPKAVTNSPKRGFTFPIEAWLCSDLRTSFENVVLDQSNSEFWDLAALRILWQTYLEGKVHWSIPWQFYSFARWYKTRHA